MSRSKSRAPKKTRTNTVSTYVPRAPNTMPRKILVTLNYATSYLPTAILFDKIFQANSCYDPDFSGSGHQPMGFDQWMALYSRYRVHASTIRVTTINKSTTVSTLPDCVVYPTTQTTASTGTEEAAEMVDNKESTSGVATGPAEDTVYRRATTCGVIGVDSINNSSEFSGSAIANPTTPWYWRVVHDNGDGANLNLQCNIQMTFTTEFYAPAHLVQS